MMLDLWNKFKVPIISFAVGLTLGAGAVWFVGGSSEDMGVALPSTVRIKVGEAATISAKARGPVTWFVPPYKGVVAHGTEKDISFFAGTAGEYWVGATSLVNRKPAPPAFVQIFVEGSSPNPPDPVDPPSPAASKLWVIVVHDPAKDTPELAALLNDKSLRDGLESKGHKFRKYSNKKADLSSGGWKAALAKAKTLPALILMEPDGKIRDAVSLPATEQGVMDAVKKAGGI